MTTKTPKNVKAPVNKKAAKKPSRRAAQAKPPGEKPIKIQENQEEKKINGMSKINDLAVFFSLTIGRFSITKKVQADQVEVDADKDRIGVKKKILDSNAYKEIRSADRNIRRYLTARSLPSLLRRGVYVLPAKLVPEIESAMETFQAERQEKIEVFLNAYEDEVNKARASLRSLFDEKDYPPVEQVKDAFTLSYRIFSAEVPESLANISSLVYEREKERAKKFWDDSKALIEETLTGEFCKLVTHLQERLTTDPGEKPKTFQQTLLTNFDEWVAWYDARNLTDNKALTEVVRKAQDALRGVGANDLRKDEKLRETIQQSFTEIKKTADMMLVNKPSRLMTLDDED